MYSAIAVWRRALARMDRRIAAAHACPCQDHATLVRQAVRTANLIYPYPPNYRAHLRRKGG